MGQYCFARCLLSASSVVVCNTRGRSAASGPGAWPVRRPTLHGGTVELRCVRATYITAGGSDAEGDNVDDNDIRPHRSDS